MLMVSVIENCSYEYLLCLSMATLLITVICPMLDDDMSLFVRRELISLSMDFSFYSSTFTVSKT